MVLIDRTAVACGELIASIHAKRDFHELARSASLEAVLAISRSVQPSIVLLNVATAGTESQMLAGALHGAATASRVILMGLPPCHDDLAGFVRARVAGFVMADASFDDFLDTVRSVARGIEVLPPVLTRSLFEQLSAAAAPGPPDGEASGTEVITGKRTVAELVRQGESIPAIAAEHGTTTRRARRGVSAVLAQLTINGHVNIGALSLNAPAAAPPSRRPRSRFLSWISPVLARPFELDLFPSV